MDGTLRGLEVTEAWRAEWEYEGGTRSGWEHVQSLAETLAWGGAAVLSRRKT